MQTPLAVVSPIARWWGVAVALSILPPGFAQQSGEAGSTFYTSFQGNSSSLGQVMRLDPSIGYRFNRFFEVDFGLPFYFIRPSVAATQNFAGNSESGLGNSYTDLRLSFRNPVVNYGSTLTVTAPTGDRDKGLSTGKVTWDWNNHFNKKLGPLAPFVNAGVANAITDTPFFIRPYISRGFVSHIEGGASWNFLRLASIGASAYAYEPSGKQTVVSRVVRRGSSAGGGETGQGRGSGKRVFESVAGDVRRSGGHLPRPRLFAVAGPHSQPCCFPGSRLQP
jgi:hypothetical protein